MRKPYQIALLGLWGLACTLQAQEWPKALPEARPAVRWWWLGSAVDSANLTYNLETYARAGLGGVEITPIYGVQGNDARELSYLGADWMRMLRHTEAEGERLGIEVDMNNGTGWPFGGPSVTVEDAACKALFRTLTVEGGQEVTLDLRPEEVKQRKVARLSRVMAYEPQSGRCLNLTPKGNPEEMKWQAPQGHWQVVILHIGRTLQKVKRAAPGGEGYVIDHLDHGAVERYLQTFEKAFKQYGTPYPHTLFNDSYEVHYADWTPDLLEAFARRRGYRLEEHFPAFLSEERNEETRRIVSDYRETMSELLIENFTTQWSSWARRHGSLTRNQAHGSPSNLIDTYAAVDIPECEGFGLSQFHIEGLRQDSLTRKNDSDLSMLKYASSAAHITGKRFTSSETFTWLTEHFRTSLSQCKPDMDLMFVSGVNHMFFHGTAYSPREAKWPGWKFYASIDMSPTNTLWRDAPAFFQYITRCQSFLQWGEPDNDFLVYLPVYDMWEEQPGRLLMFTIHEMGERAPKFIRAVNAITESGYDMDYISDRYLLSTRCKNGTLVTAGGTGYKALIVPAVRNMPVETLQHLIKLAEAGATILFTEHYPTSVPGYGRQAKQQPQLEALLKKLPSEEVFAQTTVTPYKQGRLITGNDYRAVLERTEVAAEEMKLRCGLSCIRRKNSSGYHYFISSLQAKGVDDWVTLGVPAQAAMIFDPMTGEKGAAEIRQTVQGTQVHLQLASGESLLLQTFDAPLTGVEPWRYLQEQPLALNLRHGWVLDFPESTPAIEGSYPIDTPRSWTTLEVPQAQTNMGTGRYTVHFTLPSWEADEWMLDLGDVRESARVYVNGQPAGTAWAVPFRLKVGSLLHAGENELQIEVTNLPANRIAEMDRQGEVWRIFKEINVVNLQYKKKPYNDWQPLPSGLNSSVQLIPMKRIK
jgi:hypothetical protein